MLNTIIDAINQRKTLALTYKLISREVEPHAVGKSSKGELLLRCYQTRGGHVEAGHEWDLLKVSNIVSLRLTGEGFAGPRPGYKRGDKMLAVILAQL